MRIVLLSLALILGVVHPAPGQAPPSAPAKAKAPPSPEVINARKAAALRTLKDRNYGGAKYWDCPRSIKMVHDSSAMGVLTRAGYTQEAAAQILSQMRAAGKNQPRPAKNPAFTQPQGQRRGPTEGAQGNKGLRNPAR